jgi:hypothetical protein
MKTFIALTVATLLSATAFAEALTYTEIVFNKNNQDQNGLFYLASPFKKWCAEITTVVQFNSFEAAQYVESMNNGFYLCQGKFVSGQYVAPLQIFAITNCTLENPAKLKERCQN